MTGSEYTTCCTRVISLFILQEFLLISEGSFRPLDPILSGYDITISINLILQRYFMALNLGLILLEGGNCLASIVSPKMHFCSNTLFYSMVEVYTISIQDSRFIINLYNF